MTETVTIEVEIPASLVEALNDAGRDEHYLDRGELVRDLTRAHVSGEFETVQSLIARGLSPTQAVDYLAIEERGYGIQEWGEMRETSFQAVSSNAQRAREVLTSGEPQRR